MKQLMAEITEHGAVGQGFYKMRIKSSYLAKKSAPGQFVKVRCSESYDPLLRRPFGVHRILNNGIEILYEVVGRGTELLSQKRTGEYIDIIGPLGNGFTLNRPTGQPANRQTILVAGGIGVAPLMALAESMVHRKKKKIYVLIGACKKGHILCEKEFKKLGAEVLTATEDGSQGHKGLVTEVLKNLLTTNIYQLSAIYACGPVGMLKAVARVAQEKNIPCQVSLEERMACGVGVCLGCPVKVRSQYAIRNTQYEYKMVCKDGPVFNAEEIAW